MKPTRKNVQALEDAFDSIDWKQPKAHAVYDELHSKLASILLDLKHTSNRDSSFYNLGVAVGHANQKYKTIPPISFADKEKVNP
jgi:hypothetical protein